MTAFACWYNERLQLSAFLLTTGTRSYGNHQKQAPLYPSSHFPNPYLVSTIRELSLGQSET